MTDYQERKFFQSLLWSTAGVLENNATTRLDLVQKMSNFLASQGYDVQNLFDTFIEKDEIVFHNLYEKYKQCFVNSSSIEYFTQNGRYNHEFVEKELIAIGGYSHVYKVTNKTDKHNYAVKKIRILGNEFVDIEKSLNELKIFSSLENEFIVQHKSAWFEDIIYNYDHHYGENDSIADTKYRNLFKPVSNLTLMIQMELCETTLDMFQENLYNELNSVSKNIVSYLPPMVMYLYFQLFIEIVEGLNYLHTRYPPIIHRDIKLTNILIKTHSNKKFIKICDFGLTTYHSNHTMSHTSRVGTNDYIAPEVLGGRYYNEKADIYSVGILMYKLLGYESISTWANKTEKTFNGDTLNYAKLTDRIKSIICNYENLTSINPENRPKAVEILCDENKFSVTFEEVKYDRILADFYYNWSANNYDQRNLVNRVLSTHFENVYTYKTKKFDKILSLKSFLQQNILIKYNILPKESNENKLVKLFIHAVNIHEDFTELTNFIQNELKNFKFSFINLKKFNINQVIDLLSKHRIDYYVLYSDKNYDNCVVLINIASYYLISFLLENNKGVVELNENYFEILFSFLKENISIYLVLADYYNSHMKYTAEHHAKSAKFFVSTPYHIYIFNEENIFCVTEKENIETQNFINLKEEIKQIGVNSQHTLILTDSGVLYQLVNTEFSVEKNINNYKQFDHEKSLNKSLNNSSVTKISFGLNHTLVLTTCGEVFAFGRNNYGQLGSGNNDDSLHPIQIDKIKKELIFDISTGDNHSCALTVQGRLFTWGCNSNGQLGNGENKNQFKPLLAESEINFIIKTLCCKNSSFILSATGDIFTCGELIKSNFFVKINDDSINFLDMCVNYNDNLLISLSKNKECFIFGILNDKEMVPILTNTSINYYKHCFFCFTKSQLTKSIIASSSDKYESMEMDLIVLLKKALSDKNSDSVKYADKMRIQNLNSACQAVSFFGFKLLAESSMLDKCYIMLSTEEFINKFISAMKEFKIEYCLINTSNYEVVVIIFDPLYYLIISWCFEKSNVVTINTILNFQLEKFTKIYKQFENAITEDFNINNYKALINLSESKKASIKTLFSDYNRMFLIDFDDKVFSLGKNTSSCLGLGFESNYVIEPTLIKELCDIGIVNFIFSVDYMVALTENNVLFTWGKNRFGQLGHKEKKCYRPKEVNLFIKSKVSRIICSEIAIIILTTLDDVYVIKSGTFIKIDPMADRKKIINVYLHEDNIIFHVDNALKLIKSSLSNEKILICECNLSSLKPSTILLAEKNASITIFYMLSVDGDLNEVTFFNEKLLIGKNLNEEDFTKNKLNPTNTKLKEIYYSSFSKILVALSHERYCYIKTVQIKSLSKTPIRTVQNCLCVYTLSQATDNSLNRSYTFLNNAETEKSDNILTEINIPNFKDVKLVQEIQNAFKKSQSKYKNATELINYLENCLKTFQNGKNYKFSSCNLQRKDLQILSNFADTLSNMFIEHYLFSTIDIKSTIIIIVSFLDYHYIYFLCDLNGFNFEDNLKVKTVTSIIRSYFDANDKECINYCEYLSFLEEKKLLENSMCVFNSNKNTLVMTNDKRFFIFDNASNFKELFKLNNIEVYDIQSTSFETFVLTKNGDICSFENINYDKDVINENLYEEIKVETKETPKRIVKLSVGVLHVLALSEDSKLYSWGSNCYGQLGLPNADTEINSPHLIQALKHVDIKDIACGAYHSCALTTFGELYIWGKHSHDSRVKEIFSPKNVKFPEIKIIKIICSNNLTFMLTTNGDIYKTNENNVLESFIKINKESDKFFDIVTSSSETFLVATSIDGFCYIYGHISNPMYSLNNLTKTSMKIWQNCYFVYSMLQHTIKPIYLNANNEKNEVTELKLIQNLCSKTIIVSNTYEDLQLLDEIKQLVSECVSFHAIKLIIETTTKFHVYVLHSTKQSLSDFVRIMNEKSISFVLFHDQDINMVVILFSYIHFKSLDIFFEMNYLKDNLDSFNLNLKKLTKKRIFNLWKILSHQSEELLKQIQILGVSDKTCFFITKNDEFISIEHNNVVTGRKINLLSNIKVFEFSFGNSHTIVLTKDGKLYSFGQNNYGQLGFPKSVCESSDIPKELTNFKDEKFVFISCGSYFTVCMTDVYRIYLFGDITNGEILSVNSKIVNGKHLSISCSKLCAYVISDNEYVYQLKKAMDGNLLVGQLENICLMPKKIVCSNSKIYLLSYNGNIYELNENNREEVKQINEDTDKFVIIYSSILSNTMIARSTNGKCYIINDKVSNLTETPIELPSCASAIYTEPQITLKLIKLNTSENISSIISYLTSEKFSLSKVHSGFESKTLQNIPMINNLKKLPHKYKYNFRELSLEDKSFNKLHNVFKVEDINSESKKFLIYKIATNKITYNMINEIQVFSKLDNKYVIGLYDYWYEDNYYLMKQNENLLNFEDYRKYFENIKYLLHIKTEYVEFKLEEATNFIRKNLIIKQHNLIHPVGLYLACQLFKSIVLCVDYLHYQNTPIIHNNLRIENVYITSKNNCINAKLGNFGLPTVHNASNDKTIDIRCLGFILEKMLLMNTSYDILSNTEKVNETSFKPNDNSFDQEIFNTLIITNTFTIEYRLTEQLSKAKEMIDNMKTEIQNTDEVIKIFSSYEPNIEDILQYLKLDFIKRNEFSLENNFLCHILQLKLKSYEETLISFSNILIFTKDSLSQKSVLPFYIIEEFFEKLEKIGKHIFQNREICTPKIYKIQKKIAQQIVIYREDFKAFVGYFNELREWDDNCEQLLIVRSGLQYLFDLFENVNLEMDSSEAREENFSKLINDLQNDVNLEYFDTYLKECCHYIDCNVEVNSIPKNHWWWNAEEKSKLNEFCAIDYFKKTVTTMKDNEICDVITKLNQINERAEELRDSVNCLSSDSEHIIEYSFSKLHRMGLKLIEELDSLKLCADNVISLGHRKKECIVKIDNILLQIYDKAFENLKHWYRKADEHSKRHTVQLSNENIEILNEVKNLIEKENGDNRTFLQLEVIRLSLNDLIKTVFHI